MQAESQKAPEDNCKGEELLERIRVKATAAADALMLSDAPLLFPPGQLALAALRSAVKSVQIPSSAAFIA